MNELHWWINILFFEVHCLNLSCFSDKAPLNFRLLFKCHQPSQCICIHLQSRWNFLKSKSVNLVKTIHKGSVTLPMACVGASLHPHILLMFAIAWTKALMTSKKAMAALGSHVNNRTGRLFSAKFFEKDLSFQHDGGRSFFLKTQRYVSKNLPTTK